MLSLSGLIISIHAPRVGGDGTASAFDLHRGISIHAPRVGGDRMPEVHRLDLMAISIHAPRVGGDPHGGYPVFMAGVISIHAHRVGGDGLTQVQLADELDFNPRPPCGGRPFLHGISD